MFIRKLRPGERALETVDRISLERRSEGRISWTGSVGAGAGHNGMSPTAFATVQEAETDAIAWARSRGATEILIEGPPIH